jgi:hypothetical protein
MRRGRLPTPRSVQVPPSGLLVAICREQLSEAHVTGCGESPSEPPENLPPRLQDQAAAVRADRELGTLAEAQLLPELGGDDEASLSAEPDG